MIDKDLSITNTEVLFKFIIKDNVVLSSVDVYARSDGDKRQG